MAEVNEYIIINQNNQVYRCEGTDHKDAMRSFVADPALVVGFHGGDYDCTDGESFTVIGSGVDGPMTVVQLYANERKSYVFLTYEETIHRDSIRANIEQKFAATDDGSKVELIVTENRRTPPYDLVSDDLDFRDEGVRINNVTVPWGCVLDLVEA
jgi:hypothetical protein